MIGRALTDKHDLFASNNRIAVVSDADEVLQHIKTRLWLFLGEWFLDVTDGVPWFQEVFVKPADLREIESIIKDRVLQTPGVDELIEFDMNYDNNTRRFSITLACATIFGATATDTIEVTI